MCPSFQKMYSGFLKLSLLTFIRGNIRVRRILIENFAQLLKSQHAAYIVNIKIKPTAIYIYDNQNHSLIGLIKITYAMIHNI